jgi:alcohol dehydrogenase class IV
MSMVSASEVPAFAVKRVPEVHFGPGRARAIAEDAAALGHPRKPVVLISDRAMVELGVAARLTAALEASTNRCQHPWSNLYAHRALGLIAGALETAVHEPGNLVARGHMLLGAAHAGIAIDNCGCALAHNISHALAALGPVHHGLATALALEVVLPWQVAKDQGPFAAAAEACGLGREAAALPEWYSGFLTRCGVERRLPAAFGEVSVAALAGEMRAPETRSMREANVRRLSDADIDRFAAAMLALA